jgi:hypothetical protein
MNGTSKAIVHDIRSSCTDRSLPETFYETNGDRKHEFDARSGDETENNDNCHYCCCRTKTGRHEVHVLVAIEIESR